jgi:hypothetical protein
LKLLGALVVQVAVLKRELRNERDFVPLLSAVQDSGSPTDPEASAVDLGPLPTSRATR